MSQPVLVGSSAWGLWFASRSGDYAEVRLVGLGLDVTTSVYAVNGDGFDGLVEFFNGMERDWRGWDGVREWKALEGELELSATHDGGHLRFEVRVRDSIRALWTVETSLSIEPGEQLAAAARGLQALFGAQ